MKKTDLIRDNIRCHLERGTSIIADWRHLGGQYIRDMCRQRYDCTLEEAEELLQALSQSMADEVVRITQLTRKETEKGAQDIFENWVKDGPSEEMLGCVDDNLESL